MRNEPNHLIQDNSLISIGNLIVAEKEACLRQHEHPRPMEQFSLTSGRGWQRYRMMCWQRSELIGQCENGVNTIHFGEIEITIDLVKR
jgi:hypothetical protein